MNDQDASQGNRSLELCKRVVTTESFIAEAKEIYGDRYDYSRECRQILRNFITN